MTSVKIRGETTRGKRLGGGGDVLGAKRIVTVRIASAGTRVQV